MKTTCRRRRLLQSSGKGEETRWESGGRVLFPSTGFPRGFPSVLCNKISTGTPQYLSRFPAHTLKQPSIIPSEKANVVDSSSRRVHTSWTSRAQQKDATHNLPTTSTHSVHHIEISQLMTHVKRGGIYRERAFVTHLLQ